MIAGSELALFVVLGTMILLGLLLVVLAPVYHAWRRGYNPLVWAVASFFSNNPIFILVVLASVPHRRRVRLRDEFTRQLDAKLAARTGPRPAEPTAGDARIETSALGDRATEFPRDRSVGDDLTRL